MTSQFQVIVFGEVLFDCLPSGEQVLGGAPFNVAWHLQALGDQPLFISRVGNDDLGTEIIQSAADWGMATTMLRKDSNHPTGRVNVSFENNEPHYSITPDSAYDFVEIADVNLYPRGSLLYHGTLALRNQTSRSAFLALSQKNPELSIFLDVNLRSPWWQTDQVNLYLEKARWVKLNIDELHALGFNVTDYHTAMADFQARYPLELLLLTLGEKGAIVRNKDGNYQRVVPDSVANIADTVGAGDAFSAMFIHGIRAGWPLAKTLVEAQRLAGEIIKIHGATPASKDFYRDFTG